MYCLKFAIKGKCFFVRKRIVLVQTRFETAIKFKCILWTSNSSKEILYVIEQTENNREFNDYYMNGDEGTK